MNKLMKQELKNRLQGQLKLQLGGNNSKSSERKDSLMNLFGNLSVPNTTQNENRKEETKVEDHYLNEQSTEVAASLSLAKPKERILTSHAAASSYTSLNISSSVLSQVQSQENHESRISKYRLKLRSLTKELEVKYPD